MTRIHIQDACASATKLAAPRSAHALRAGVLAIASVPGIVGVGNAKGVARGGPQSP